MASGELVGISAQVEDIDGSIEKVEWTQLQGPEISFVNNNELEVQFISPDVDIETELIVRLEVTDNEIEKTTLDIHILIKPIDNEAPIINVIFPLEKSVNKGASILVKGTVSDGNEIDGIDINGMSVQVTEIAGGDNEADSLNYQWQAYIATEQLGKEGIQVKATDKVGNESIHNANIFNEISIFNIALNINNNDLIITNDSSLYVKDAINSTLTLIDNENQKLYVLSSKYLELVALHSIDVESKVIISEDLSQSINLDVYAHSVAYSPLDEKVYISANTLFKFDMRTLTCERCSSAYRKFLVVKSRLGD
ncbi:hypothetical protein KO527_25155 [Pseudoalteromonas sp. C2R02]|uniref:hypothetical protein n=1 Tax=Pseudoalteromonas sp. C2R02 TaxID=2841565 RepID=UPI001C099716|nr:hypothetical protein [Pseudoalteromonas sp. C2R02]MBU2972629.1 hypothetical protein [Pseudoalteromonas sp. C2R02]